MGMSINGPSDLVRGFFTTLTLHSTTLTPHFTALTQCTPLVAEALSFGLGGSSLYHSHCTISGTSCTTLPFTLYYFKISGTSCTTLPFTLYHFRYIMYHSTIHTVLFQVHHVPLYHSHCTISGTSCTTLPASPPSFRGSSWDRAEPWSWHNCFSCVCRVNEHLA
jgi:hypothetical protein